MKQTESGRDRARTHTHTHTRICNTTQIRTQEASKLTNKKHNKYSLQLVNTFRVAMVFALELTLAAALLVLVMVVVGEATNGAEETVSDVDETSCGVCCDMCDA